MPTKNKRFENNAPNATQRVAHVTHACPGSRCCKLPWMCHQNIAGNRSGCLLNMLDASRCCLDLTHIFRQTPTQLSSKS